MNFKLCGRYLALALCLLTVTGCPSESPEKLEIRKLQEKVKAMELEVGTNEAKIKDAGHDPGLRGALQSDAELHKSRLERYKLILKEKQAQ